MISSEKIQPASFRHFKAERRKVFRREFRSMSKRYARLMSRFPSGGFTQDFAMRRAWRESYRLHALAMEKTREFARQIATICADFGVSVRRFGTSQLNSKRGIVRRSWLVNGDEWTVMMPCHHQSPDSARVCDAILVAINSIPGCRCYFTYPSRNRHPNVTHRNRVYLRVEFTY